METEQVSIWMLTLIGISMVKCAMYPDLPCHRPPSNDVTQVRMHSPYLYLLYLHSPCSPYPTTPHPSILYLHSSCSPYSITPHPPILYLHTPCPPYHHYTLPTHTIPSLPLLLPTHPYYTYIQRALSTPTTPYPSILYLHCHALPTHTTPHPLILYLHPPCPLYPHYTLPTNTIPTPPCPTYHHYTPPTLTIATPTMPSLPLLHHTHPYYT